MGVEEFRYGLMYLEKLFTSKNPELQMKLTELFSLMFDVGVTAVPELTRDILLHAQELKREYGEDIEDYDSSGGSVC